MDTALRYDSLCVHLIDYLICIAVTFTFSLYPGHEYLAG